MEILFLILKIIGILLAVVFGLILIALTVPVRYRIGMKAWDEITGTVIISWLFRLIKVQIQYQENRTEFFVKILGIAVMPKKEKSRKRRKKNKKQKDVVDTFPNENEELQVEISDTENFSVQEDNVTQNPVIQEFEETESLAQPKKKKKQRTQKTKKPSNQEFSRSRTFREEEEESQHPSTLQTIKEKVQNIKNLIFEETSKNAFLHIFKEFKCILRHFFPRKVSGTLAFGLKDPALTGQILGAFCLIPFWANYHIDLKPDFQTEHPYVKGELSMKGHIRCCHTLLIAFRLIKDKNIKTWIKKFRAQQEV
ncbi:MAG: DUF2953 domain-containing protein [Lachnospiraceae bacterium]|jgi:hypothetical protein|nr:DUF2953 domain-containing protein [Lachnospiraceae bacterium]